MSNDMLMVRGEIPGQFSLAVGEPVFLQEKLYFTAGKVGSPNPDHRYPPLGGNERLIDNLFDYHKNQYEHIVITNGAKQAILAALYALDMYNLKNKSVKLSAPYWPSYPTLAKLSGYKVSLNGVTGLIASPNNPDGAEAKEEIEDGTDIWDAAYAHSVYGWSGVSPYHTVSVWSAAKLFGTSNLRIGWLATNHKMLAARAAEYVEKTTSGVCTDSQLRLADIIDYVNNRDTAHIYGAARTVLIENGRMFNDKLAPYCSQIQGVPTTGKGMFAFFRVREWEWFDVALINSYVKVIPGAACGMTQPGWFRMSMGQTNSYTEQALDKLVSKLPRLR